MPSKLELKTSTSSFALQVSRSTQKDKRTIIEDRLAELFVEAMIEIETKEVMGFLETMID